MISIRWAFQYYLKAVIQLILIWRIIYILQVTNVLITRLLFSVSYIKLNY